MRNTYKEERLELETIIFCIIGGAIWWLLSSQLSASAWMLCALVVFCIVAAAIVWWAFRGSDPEPKPSVPAPIPKAGVEIKKP